MIVKLCQCLCPQRHCLLASIGEGDDEALKQSLKNQLRDLIVTKKINPWCGLCGARARDWIYEVGITKHTNLEDALHEATREQAKQLTSAAHLRATGQAYDSPVRN